jgi:hypothetical protein
VLRFVLGLLAQASAIMADEGDAFFNFGELATAVEERRREEREWTRAVLASNREWRRLLERGERQERRRRRREAYREVVARQGLLVQVEEEDDVERRVAWQWYHLLLRLLSR